MPKSDKSASMVRLDKSRAAHTSWYNTDNRTERTAPARQAFEDSFEKKVRKEFPGLSDAEVAVRAKHARKIHFLAMAKRSAEVRRTKPVA